jgi:hypothetical protein
MTFNEWWATLDTREQARMVKADVAEACAAIATCAKQCMGRHSLDVEAQECAKAVRKLKEKI